MKRFLLSLVALGALLGIAHAVNITGVDGSDTNRVQAVGFLRMSVTDTITAASGGGQTNAVLLTSAYNRVTTVAAGNDSVRMPACQGGSLVAVGNGQPVNTIGQIMYITNAAAANSLNVFPSTGQAINAGGTNGAFALPVTFTVAFICGTAGQWYTMPKVPS